MVVTTARRGRLACRPRLHATQFYFPNPSHHLGYTGLPLGVGFGIGTPEAAASVAEIADAVIVGSAIVKRMEEFAAEPDKILIELPKFLAELRAAMDQSRAALSTAGGAHA